MCVINLTWFSCGTQTRRFCVHSACVAGSLNWFFSTVKYFSSGSLRSTVGSSPMMIVVVVLVNVRTRGNSKYCHCWAIPFGIESLRLVRPASTGAEKRVKLPNVAQTTFLSVCVCVCLSNTLTHYLVYARAERKKTQAKRDVVKETHTHTIVQIKKNIQREHTARMMSRSHNARTHTHTKDSPECTRRRSTVWGVWYRLCTHKSWVPGRRGLGTLEFWKTSLYCRLNVCIFIMYIVRFC